MHLNKAIGRRLAELRAGAGLSQAELARLVGSSAKAISLLENGHNTPSLGRLQELAAALKVEIKELFSFDRAPLPPMKKSSPHDVVVARFADVIKARPIDEAQDIVRALAGWLRRYPLPKKRSAP